MGNARLYQMPVEILSTGNPGARVYQYYSELLSTGNPGARVFQNYLEVVTFATSVARVYQTYIEVLEFAETSEILEDEISDTLTLTDSFSATSGDLSDTLTFSETLSPTTVLSLSLSDTVTLTELVNTIVVGEFEDTLVLDDEIEGEASKIGSWTDTLSLTEDLARNVVWSRMYGDALDLAEAIQRNISKLLDFSDVVTFTEDLDGVAVKVLGDNVTFSDLLSYFIAKLMQDDIEFGDAMFPNVDFQRSGTDQLIPFDSIAIKLFSRLSASDTLIFTDTMVGFGIKPLETDTVPFSDTVSGEATKPLNDTLTITETVTFNKVLNKSLSDTVAFSESLTSTKVLTVQLLETLNFVEEYLGIRARFGTMSDTLTFSDQILREVHQELIEEPMVFTDEILVQKLGSRDINEELDLEETLTTTNVLVRDITDYFVFREGFVVKVTRAPGSVGTGTGIGVSPPVSPLPPGTEQPLPVPDGVIDVYSQLTLIGKTRSMVLPPPEFNDFIANQGKILVQRSMTGNFRVYAKRTNREKVNWRFIIPKYKADELREFMLAEIDNDIRVIDWEGNIWDFKLLSDTVDFTESGRWAKSETENCGNKTEVTIEFVGTKYA